MISNIFLPLGKKIHVCATILTKKQTFDVRKSENFPVVSTYKKLFETVNVANSNANTTLVSSMQCKDHDVMLIRLLFYLEKTEKCSHFSFVPDACQCDCSLAFVDSVLWVLTGFSVPRSGSSIVPRPGHNCDLFDATGTIKRTR